MKVKTNEGSYGISSLSIFDAEGTTRKIVDDFVFSAGKIDCVSKQDFINSLLALKKEKLSTIPSNPLVRNALNFLVYDLASTYVSDLKRELFVRANKINSHFKDVEEKVVLFGSDKVVNNMVIFTNHYNLLVNKLLIQAVKESKKFLVLNTESRPFMGGALAAKELSSAGIKVVHHLDSGARLALKKADMVLFGADAIFSSGHVVSCVGSEMLAEIASKYEVPVFVCADSWVFDSGSIFDFDSHASAAGVLSGKPSNSSFDFNHFAFERVDPELIAGVISEFGVLRPKVFVREVKKNNQWMF